MKCIFCEKEFPGKFSVCPPCCLFGGSIIAGVLSIFIVSVPLAAGALAVVGLICAVKVHRKIGIALNLLMLGLLVIGMAGGKSPPEKRRSSSFTRQDFVEKYSRYLLRENAEVLAGLRKCDDEEFTKALIRAGNAADLGLPVFEDIERLQESE